MNLRTRERLINNGYSIIGFLSVSISDFNYDDDKIVNNTAHQDSDSQFLPLKDGVLLTAAIEGTEQNMFVLHNALNCSLNAL